MSHSKSDPENEATSLINLFEKIAGLGDEPATKVEEDSHPKPALVRQEVGLLDEMLTLTNANEEVIQRVKAFASSADSKVLHSPPQNHSLLRKNFLALSSSINRQARMWQERQSTMPLIQVPIALIQYIAFCESLQFLTSSTIGSQTTNRRNSFALQK